MLNVFQVKCPNCHAPQKLAGEQQETICPFCGQPFLLQRAAAGAKPEVARSPAAAGSTPQPATQTKHSVGRGLPIFFFVLLLLGGLPPLLIVLLRGTGSPPAPAPAASSGSPKAGSARPAPARRVLSRPEALFFVINHAEKAARQEVGQPKVQLIEVDVPRLERDGVDTEAAAAATFGFGYEQAGQKGTVRVSLNKGQYLARRTDDIPPVVQGRITRCPAEVFWKSAVAEGVPDEATASLRLEQHEGRWRWILAVSEPPAHQLIFDAATCRKLEGQPSTRSAEEQQGDPAPLSCDQVKRAVCGAIDGVGCFQQAGVLGGFGAKVIVDLRDGRPRRVRAQGQLRSRVRRCLLQQANRARVDGAAGRARVSCSWGGTLMPGGRIVSSGSDCSLGD